MKLRIAALAAAMLLAGCETYTAQTTYDKLAPAYPFIRIASDAVPATVVAHRNLTYIRHASGSLRLDLYLPAAPAERAMPAVVWVHGGGWRAGRRGNMAPLAIRMAQRGYASATISYRLSGEALYPAAIDDVKAAVRWLREQAPRYGIDPDRIAIGGGSAGGQIAALAGMTSAGVQAVINIDGLSDFTAPEALVHEDDPAKKPSAAGAWFGGRYHERTALWREASPTFHVSAKSPPVLFIASAQPRFSVGRDAMVAKLAAHGVASSVVMLPDSPHSFWLFDPWIGPTVDACAAFLDQHLGSRYSNPVLHADYSDPDAVRVGDMFYMTSSSFTNVPGLPLLQSRDMVRWELVGHALPQLVPEAAFAEPQPGKGVWAPSLRHHNGKFWIFYPDPDHGVYVITADHFAGPWTKPHLLLPGKGIIDPAPLWDEDGKAWLVHAWAKSRAGFNNVLTLRRMAPDGRSLLDDAGTVIIDGHKLPGYRTLEGPKLYRHDGYYYVFAPAGGVEEGWQSVFRSRSIGGPYEDRIVMAQGRSPVNGPHQGAWVRAQDGRDWFLHFQDKRAYGRIVHLQPMQWKDGWPLIGEDPDGVGVGQPVAGFSRPAIARGGMDSPPESDEFNGPSLGPQWQWNANPRPGWHALGQRAGHLRLQSMPSSVVLTQKLPAPAFSVDVRLEQHGSGSAGLVMSGARSAWIGLDGDKLVFADGATSTTLASGVDGAVDLRMRVSADGMAHFSYSLDRGSRYVAAPAPFKISMGRWVGAQMGLFARGGGHAEIDYFRVRR